MAQNELTKTEISEQARNLGAEVVGFASVEQWEQSRDNPVAIHPQTIWPPAKTVIVLGIPYLPVAALPATGSLAGWNAASELLDAAAYRLAVFLNGKGYPAVNIPRDSSGENSLEDKTVPLFSHFWAGYYAGVLPARPQDRPEELPRLNLVSLLTVFS